MGTSQYQENEFMGDGSILINLNNILSSLLELCPDNPLIIVKSLKLINSMAFKNQMEVRRQMKLLKMFELRDRLIIKHLKNLYEIAQKNNQEVQTSDYVSGEEMGAALLTSTSDFSFDVVSSKPTFKEHFG